jgi:hypothetical protein
MKLFTTLSLLVAFISTLSAQDLRTALESNYASFSEAVKNKDGDKLKASMSSYSYVTAKNEMQSAQVAFPDGYFSSAPRMVTDLKKQTFLKAIENGPTANSVYYGKDAFGSASLMIIKFLKENNSWKFMTVQYKSSEEIMNKLKAKDTSFLKNKDFYPSGVLPVAPVEMSAGDYKGLLDIMGLGFTVQVKINGINQPGPNGGVTFSGLEEGSSDMLILGGIKKGVNKIEITTTPIPGKKTEKLLINVAFLMKDQEYEVFSLEEDKPAAFISKEFTVK